MKRVVIRGCFLCSSVLYRRRWRHPSLALTLVLFPLRMLRRSLPGVAADLPSAASEGHSAQHREEISPRGKCLWLIRGVATVAKTLPLVSSTADKEAFFSLLRLRVTQRFLERENAAIGIKKKKNECADKRGGIKVHHMSCQASLTPEPKLP